MTIGKKFIRLKDIIKSYRSCLVAFSAGVDSTFLLKAASLALPKEDILAVTAASATYPKEELKQAKMLARYMGIRHKVVTSAELKDKRFVANPPNRCYFCKKKLFLLLKRIAGKEKLSFVLDGSNISDGSDFRPGSLAGEELRIKSPLKEAGLTKKDIRILSRKLKLPTSDKPSLACLASRIPYNMKITPAVLKRIELAEGHLKSLFFGQARLRHHGTLCRIEVSKNDLPRLLRKRKTIVDRLKKLGYNYITMDLEGYRRGSLNSGLREKQDKDA
ncbi:MAG: ATP-dependent sacrificial sulfur transferase LarE [Candidatus Omnitrophota bacterium]